MDLEHSWYVSDGFAWRITDLLASTRRYPNLRLPLTDLLTSYRSTTTDEHKGSHKFRERALSSDLRYPILVAKGLRGGYHIVDGRHRVWKAQHLGYSTINAKVFPLEDLMLFPHEPYEEFVMAPESNR